MPLPHVDTKTRQLATASGRPLFIKGVNYLDPQDPHGDFWANKAFDAERIAADFKLVAETGFNVVRFFISPSLESDLSEGHFNRLDRVIQLAANQSLLILLGLADLQTSTLSRLARRYAEDPILLGWDLAPALSFQQLATATYPQAVPLQQRTLLDAPGPKISQSEALAQQAQGHLPSELGPQAVWLYANARARFKQLLAAATRWSQQHRRALPHFLTSPAAADWQPIITALNDTLNQWLALRQNALRTAGDAHLITLTHQNPLLAALPANKRLNLISLHRPGPATSDHFRHSRSLLAALADTFPQHPLLLTAYGHPSPPSNSPTAALFETALLAHLQANGYAGGLKWHLLDTNPAGLSENQAQHPAHFGIFQGADYPKALPTWLQKTRKLWPTLPANGTFNWQLHGQTLGYRLTHRTQAHSVVILGGGTFQDDRLCWHAETPGLCLIVIRYQPQQIQLEIQALSPGQLTLHPVSFSQTWPGEQAARLSRHTENGLHLLRTAPPGHSLTWSLHPAESYLIQPQPQTSPAFGQPLPQPNPGEHVALLANREEALRHALPYLRTFAPDVSFTPTQVSGRWAYVTVFGQPEDIPDEQLAEFRAAGAVLVQRLAGDVAAQVDQLISQNSPFLPPETPQS